MQSFVNVPVTVERAFWYRGRSWFVSWVDPMGLRAAACAVVDDFGNLVAVP